MKLWKFKWINPNLRKYSLFKFFIIPDNFKVTVAFVRRLLILVIKTSTYIQYIYIYIYIYISYTYHIYAYIASLFQSIQTNFHREKLSLTETNIHIRVSSYLRRQNEMKFLIRNNLSMEKILKCRYLGLPFEQSVCFTGAHDRNDVFYVK